MTAELGPDRAVTDISAHSVTRTTQQVLSQPLPAGGPLSLESHLLKNAAMNMGAIAEQHTRLELELMEERAATLRRIGRTLESLIEELRTLQQRIGKVHWSSPSPDVARYRELRRRAVQYRWYLEVQREALGLHHHSVLDEFYRVPNPI